MSYWVLGMLKSIRNGLKRIQTNDHCQTKTKERININIISTKYISNMIIENLIAYAGFFLFITLMGTCVKIKKDLWKSD
jgi:ribonucleotide reductase beta subunit family protein with ferritin-like domain